MDRKKKLFLTRLVRPAVLLFAGLTLMCGSGCVLDLLAVMSHDFMLPAEYAGLEGKRVCVICNSAGQSLGPSSVSDQMAKAVSRKLAGNVENIQVVSQREIEQWLDTQDWAEVDAKEIARGVQADAVVLVDIQSFSLNDGPTMYKGRSNLMVTVYDMNRDGQEVFHRAPELIEWPKMSGQPVSDFQVTEDAFRHRYIEIVAEQVGRYFYPFDYRQDYAVDTAGL